MSSGAGSPLGPREVDLREDPLLLQPPRGEVLLRKDPLLTEPQPAQPPPEPWSNSYTAMSPWSILLMGVYVPCYMFVLIFTLFTFVYHHLPAAPWLTVLLCLNVVLIAMWPPAHRWNGRGRWDWFPLLSGLLAVGFAVVMGLLNYSNMEIWVHAKHLQTYNDLSPDGDPKAVTDAGIIRFAAGTALDVASSAGYRAWPYTYCAAPIVAGSASATAAGTDAAAAAAGADATAGADAAAGAGAPAGAVAAGAAVAAAPQLVGFWAVGVNCCNGQGDFWCDGASDSEVRAGLRLDSHWAGRTAGHDAGEYFRKAARKAAAAQGMEVAEPPVLLIWSRKPENVAIRAWWAAICVYAVFVLLTAVTCYGCRWLFNAFLKSRNFCK